MDMRGKARELELSTKRNELIVELYDAEDNEQIEEIKQEIKVIDKELNDLRINLYLKKG